MFFLVAPQHMPHGMCVGSRTPELYANTSWHGEAVASPRGAAATREARPTPRGVTKNPPASAGGFLCDHKQAKNFACVGESNAGARKDVAMRIGSGRGL